MSRTVTAMFDSRPEAEAAKSRLNSSNIDADRVRIIDKSSAATGYASSSGATGAAGGEGQGFWASLKDLFVDDTDRHTYGEGINRGSFLLCAEVDEDEADEAIRILDESDSVDLDQREQSWRSEGWSGYTGASDLETGASTGLTGTSAAIAGGTDRSMTDRSTTDRSSTVAEEHIPIVEEELRVGKREVSRGGARVRSYVREVPVHEQVTLREEHVSVERRPTNETMSAGELEGAFKDRNIEMTEMSEEAVVDKQARVKEELVIRKTSEDHVETIDDSVRRTEVDVDENMRGSEDRSAFGGFGSSSTDKSDPDRTDTDLEKTNFQDRGRGF